MRDTISDRHYLDWAATAIPDELTGLTNYLAVFGNPSAQNKEGRLAKEALEGARSRCAGVLGVKAEKLYFTSGGTESNALFLLSLSLRKGRVLYSGVEHPSVRENCLRLERLGLPVSAIGVEKDGRVSADTLKTALEKHPDARFVAIMGVNNETGSVMEINALVGVIRANQEKTGLPIHFHCDLVQAIGKAPVDIGDLDSASFSAHKIGGPRGIGLLYLKKPLEPLYTGGGQEGGVRPGTENTPGALALADVIERRANPETVGLEGEKAGARMKYLIGKLKKITRCALIPEDRGEEDRRFSPWILQLRLRGLPGAVTVRALDDAGVAVSTGSACSSASVERPVLAAMGVDEKTRLEGFRVSQGWSTSGEDFDALLAGIEKALSLL
ncbi:MAG: cysteine desulfurase [Treponema sp.]|jgi:cysteine desulfurase|nr:cysteine desulfurase [Treponema sp.]